MDGETSKRSPTAVEAPQARCRVGLARGDITPPIGIYHRMWGAAVHDRAEGVHRPLLATVLWLEPLEASGGPPSRQLVVAIDHCILEGPEQLKLRQAVADATETPLDEVSICLAH